MNIVIPSYVASQLVELQSKPIKLHAVCTFSITLYA